MVLRLGALSSRSLQTLLSVVAISGCAPSYQFYLHDGVQLVQAELDRILAENPLAPEENIRAVTLGKGREISHHLVQIRDREVPHIHKDHDVTVVMLRGQGYLMLGKNRLELTAGGVIFIPRGVVHFFVNTHSGPSVALALYSPAFDGKDTIPVEKP